MELPSNLEKEGKDRHWWEDIGTEERRQKNTEGNNRGRALKKKNNKFQVVSQQNKIKGKLYHRGKNEGSPRYQQKNMDLKEQMNSFGFLCGCVKVL